MLTERTKLLVEEMKEFMTECYREMGAETIFEMDSEEFNLVKLAVKLINSSTELVLEQARMLDGIDGKLDRLLNKREL